MFEEKRGASVACMLTVTTLTILYTWLKDEGDEEQLSWQCVRKEVWWMLVLLSVDMVFFVWLGVFFKILQNFF